MTGARRMATGETSEAARRDEDQWVDSAARRDPAAFARLVAEYQDRIAGLAYRLLGWRDDVDDVAQDVFVTVLENLPRFRGECRLSTWLYRITVNQCRRQRRKRMLNLKRWRAASSPERQPVPSSAAASDASLARERYERVRAAVAKLPRTYREVVVLRYLEEVPIGEIGEILGLPPNAVEVRLSRARERLKGELAEWIEE